MSNFRFIKRSKTTLFFIHRFIIDMKRSIPNTRFHKGLRVDSHTANNYRSLSRDLSLGCEFIRFGAYSCHAKIRCSLTLICKLLMKLSFMFITNIIGN